MHEEFELDLEDLSSAEDFLEYFEIDFDPAVVRVNRLHILQRFHDYLTQEAEKPGDDDTRWQMYAHHLKCAYEDFVHSDALTEKVFRVFHMHEQRPVKIALEDLLESAPHAPRL